MYINSLEPGFNDVIVKRGRETLFRERMREMLGVWLNESQ